MKYKHIFNDLKNQTHKTPVVVGKGPTSEKFKDFIKEKDKNKFITIAINDAIKINHDFNYAHFIDYEAFERCRESLGESKIITPSILHFREKLSDKSIDHALFPRHFLYDSMLYNRKLFPDIEKVTLRSRSSEAVIDILGKSGFKNILTFGINGGLEYGNQFKEIPRQKPWESHDTQFKTINEIKSMYNLQISFL